MHRRQPVSSKPTAPFATRGAAHPAVRSALLVVFAAVLAASSAFATEAPFQALPKAAEGAASGLRLKVLRYDGNTNGGMVVEVRNPTQTPHYFEAQGLYFVPNMKPDEAPQRLGAAGPFSVERGGTWVTDEKLELAPGASATLRLEVFCIDSHRSSPSAETPFRLAKARLPKGISGPIEAGTKAILQGHNAKTAREAAGAVQEHVWETRNKAWLPVEGERVDERGGKRQAVEHLEQRRLQRIEAEPVEEQR
ncbi:MAG: hypothetical protein IV100_02770 [Myxococcales bacterium]|nr:hypothetical protein [Myxococcales bacterium]